MQEGKGNNKIVLPLLTMQEAAKVLGVNRSKVDALRKAGALRCLKLGAYKVRQEELNRFMTEAEGWDYSDPQQPVRI